MNEQVKQPENISAQFSESFFIFLCLQTIKTSNYQRFNNKTLYWLY